MHRDLEALAHAGIRAVQLRDKRDPTDPGRPALARALVQACADLDLWLFLNDDPALALRVGARGAHLGPDDLPVSQARLLAGGGTLVLGASAGTVTRARASVAEGADYLGVGAIWEAWASKENASPPRGLEVLRALRAAPDLAHVPLVAIGGIDASRAPACLTAGADGVAVIRSLLGAPDVARAAAALVEACHR
jgi:thiamine-phosphate pyrophosphorylase